MDDDDRRRYLRLLGAVVHEWRWRCLGYCLMTNHVHLLIETPDGGLGAGMEWLHGTYARTFNRRHGRKNHLFGDRYGLTPIHDEQHLWFASAYVALNPVKAGMCAAPGEWPWSSHAALTGHRAAPEWLDVDRMLGFFHGIGSSPRQAYADLVAGLHR